MICSSCGNKEAVRISFSRKGEFCDRCGSLPTFQFSDVFFDAKKGAHFESNLADPNKSPLGNMVSSREGKARLMRELNVVERGDRHHGAR